MLMTFFDQFIILFSNIQSFLFQVTVIFLSRSFLLSHYLWTLSDKLMRYHFWGYSFFMGTTLINRQCFCFPSMQHNADSCTQHSHTHSSNMNNNDTVTINRQPITDIYRPMRLFPFIIIHTRHN